MSLHCLLIMKADVMVSNQYDQFCVGGMPEHSVEAAHIVLPVLCGNRQTVRQRDRLGPVRQIKSSWGKLGEIMGSLRVSRPRKLRGCGRVWTPLI